MAASNRQVGDKRVSIERRKLLHFGALAPASIAVSGIGLGSSFAFVSTGNAQQSQTIFDLALEKKGLSKSFSMKSYVGFGAKSRYVDVEIVIDKEFMQDFNITSRPEYEALVQYTLQYDWKILEEVSHGTMPRKLVFGPLQPPKGAVVHDLSAGAKKRRCWCMEPCDGAGSYCYIWLAGSGPRRAVL